ncbi:hypothetical protein Bbelb_190760 [Branchiostoma belcheri]|nr:hypothetical protein Bbelb_190760 [Branchiostoma belcheri]
MDATSLIVAESCSELCSEGQQPVQVFSTDAMRLVMTEALNLMIGYIWSIWPDWTRPNDLKTQEEYQWGLLSEPDKTDWTRPDDLKTLEKYQQTRLNADSANSCLEDTVKSFYRPDEGSTVKSLYLSRCVPKVSCPDWEKPVMMAEFYPNQMRAQQTGSLEDWKEGRDFDQ